MLPSERKKRILEILRERREASVQALSQVLEVPAANIRRDLRDLEAQNRIDRRHGRAIYRPSLVPAATIESDADLDAGHFDELVDETALVIGDAKNLFLTSGPTVVAAAKKLKDKTVATHDLAVAMAAASAGNDVTMIGSEVDNETMTLRSPGFDAELEQFWFDAVVLETDGIDDKNLWVARKNHGFLTALFARADSVIAIAKSTTVGRKGDRVAAPLARADVIVIDRGAGEDTRNAFADASAELRVAGERADLPFGLDQVGNVFVFKQMGNRFAVAADDDGDDSDG